MTPTLKRFLERLNAFGVTPNYEVVAPRWTGTSQSSPSLVIPAKHDSVGRLTVYDDADELTIEIGELHHTHFSAYNYDFETIEQQRTAATEDAARFVADVFADRVYVSVDYDDERCIGSSHGYLNPDSQPTDLVRMPDAPLFHDEATRSERYVWSGPIENKDT